MTKVLIVDDHPLFRKGVRQLVESYPGFSVLGEAGTKGETLKLAAQRKPDLVLLDLVLENESGFDVLKDLKELYPDILVLIISMHDERFYAERVLQSGARGYIMKNETGPRVMEAMKAVLSGKIWLSESIRNLIIEFMVGSTATHSTSRFASVEKLSNREFEIFTMIGKGMGNYEIAQKLNLSVKTIDTHKEHIKLKLHLASSQDLLQYAIEWLGMQRK